MNKGRQDYSKTPEKARLEEQAPGKKVYKLAAERMEREITGEHSGQEEDSLETKPPQAKVISNAQLSNMWIKSLK